MVLQVRVALLPDIRQDDTVSPPKDKSSSCTTTVSTIERVEYRV